MKNIVLVVMFIFSLNASAQITLEHTYDTASTYDLNQLMIIKFEVSGERYVKINIVNKSIDLYNMNHSFLKSISYAGFPQNANNIPIILYSSESLFDNDNEIEFMYVYTTGTVSVPHTRIYKEDGTLIFQADSMGPLVKVNTPQSQYPIYNTSYGTKMILSCTNGQAKVFSLPGTLTTDIAEANGQLMQAQSGQLSKLYPNPSNGAVTLQYELPNGETEGELILYNMQGMEVKRYKIDNTFSDILLDNTQLPAGTYFYQLQTSKGAVGTKKMVIIK
ncbi:MAG: T9SS type A sorting domain-containing protein [Bacteroidales bacterium]|jgi:hypothetical protein|nr:T9SS type A sorting domain-containing protein [Bacteroidales bacterium]